MKWRLLFCGLMLSQLLNAQNPDSLWSDFINPSLDSATRIKSLHRLTRYFIHNNPDSALILANTEKDFAEAMRDSGWLASSYNMLGGVYSVRNDFAAAMDQFYRMLDIRLAMNDTTGIGTSYNNIGNVYYYKGDFPKALEHYIRSLHYEELKPTNTGLATSYLNIGSVYALLNDNHHALDYFNRALQLYAKVEDQNGLASCYANLGNVYKDLDSLALARNTFLKAIDLMIAVKDDYGLATTYANLADVERLLGNKDAMFKAYAQCEKIRTALKDELGLANLWISRGQTYVLFGEFEQARRECAKGLRVAETKEAMSAMRDACDCLYQAYKGLNQEEKALEYYERQNKLKDKIANDETQMKLQVMEFRNQVKEDSIKREEEKLAMAVSHQHELKKGNRLRNVIIGIGFLLVLLSILLYRLFHKTRESKEAIEKEKSKADELLLNILPAEITEELMKSGKVEAQQFDNVTILFTDIVGFTEVSERLQPQQLLDALNDIYSHFDEIISKHGIEKIKSIGDAYMAAGGLPVSSVETVKNTILAALDIQDYMRKRKETRLKAGLTAFEIRLGIHTGPVVAGIIGIKKFQYDVWGDTVNTASRMEKNGEAGYVNISQSTYDLVQDDPDFTFEQRRKIPVKGKGEMQMYFVRRK